MRTHARGKIATVSVFNVSWSEPACENMVLTTFWGYLADSPQGSSRRLTDSSNRFLRALTCLVPVLGQFILVTA